MINLSRVVFSPMFMQTFKVYRSIGHFALGGFVQEAQSPAYFDVAGAVWPSSEKEIQQMPEGDRIKGATTFASTTELYVTRSNDQEEGTSDQIEWHGELYRLVSVMNYSDYGFYAAMGVRMKGK